MKRYSAKKIAISSFIAGFIVTGCAQVLSSNERQISIKAPPAAAAEAFRLADQHCRRFGLLAVPAGVVYGDVTVFECRTPLHEQNRR